MSQPPPSNRDSRLIAEDMCVPSIRKADDPLSPFFGRKQPVTRLVQLVFVGFFAQLIDGALGMGYGVTSTSMLLAVGVVPVTAAATVNMAQVFTTAASGVSHWKFGNVNPRVVLGLAGPGAIGAFLGAVFLTSIPADFARPAIAIFLFVLGVSILLRFLKVGTGQDYSAPRRVRRRVLLIPLAFVAGFVNASGGGGWGPLSTSTLMARGDMEPRRVVGSVCTSEFPVVLSGTIGFLLMMGVHGFNFMWVGALMAGGVVAAPIGAWLVRAIPPYLLGILVGGLILVLNIRTLAFSFNFDTNLTVASYIVVVTVWFASLVFVVTRQRNLVSGAEAGD